MAAPELRVTGLFVYPIKSCAGTTLQEAEVTPRGIRGDRSYMLVDEDGQFHTQRELPRMALIKPTLVEGGLDIVAPNMPSLAVRVTPDAPRRSVVVWRDTVEAEDMGDEAAEWFSRFLGTACRLVGLPEDSIRPVDRQYARRSDDQVGFADGYPFLLITEASLAGLNARLAEPLPINRFRPSLVVSGAVEPHAEEGWAEVSIGQVTFYPVKACARCAITTTNQETTERGVEPLATLATYRRIPRGVLFGQNLVHEGSGTVRVGDVVRVSAKPPDLSLVARGGLPH